MNSRAWSIFLSVPWTSCRSALAAWLFAVCLGVHWQLGVPYSQVQVALGGASELQLWSGEWWRLLTAGFHHADIGHLLLNCVVLWQFGNLLEPRWGTWRLMLFDVMALLCASVIQAYETPGNGLSGMAYAEFGLLATWRSVDPELAAKFPRTMVWMGYLWLAACIPLTAAGLFNIANLAHFSGWLYGVLAALVHCGSLRQQAWWPLFITSHVFLVPMIYFAEHPVWNGRYYWHLGDQETSRSARLKHYERATKLAPNEEAPWLNLVFLEANAGHIPEAWVRVLRLLQAHPDSHKARELAYVLAEQLAGEEHGPQAFSILSEHLAEGSLHDELKSILLRPALPDWPENLKPLPLWPATAADSGPTGLAPFSLSAEALDEQPVARPPANPLPEVIPEARPN